MRCSISTPIGLRLLPACEPIRRLPHALTRSPGFACRAAGADSELAVRAILGQQITVKGATTPGRVLGASVRTALCFPEQAFTRLSAPGRSRRRGFHLNRADQGACSNHPGTGAAVVDGKISFEGVVAPEDFLSRICEIPVSAHGRRSTLPCERWVSQMHFPPET